jgi:hypothetical protein
MVSPIFPSLACFTFTVKLPLDSHAQAKPCEPLRQALLESLTVSMGMLKTPVGTFGKPKGVARGVASIKVVDVTVEKTVDGLVIVSIHSWNP